MVDIITGIPSRIESGSMNEAIHAASISRVGAKLLVIGEDPDTLLPLPFMDITCDIHDEFDAVLVINGTAIEICQQRMSSSNPLAPVICGPGVTLPHCDCTLDAWTAGTLKEAVAKVRSISKAAADFPKLALESNRDALVMLGSAFTRGVDIDARWAPDRREMISYPLLWCFESPRDLLEELADAKLLHRTFFDCVSYCPRCHSSRLVAREVCTSCSASHLSESPLVHHYRCSYQGPQTSFHRGESGLVCPKCDRTLRHYGVDYDKPGTIATCMSCTATMSDPAVSFICVDCGVDSRGETVGKQDWHNYSLSPDGISALRAGRLPNRDFSPRSDSGNASHSIRDFRFLVDQLLPIAKRHVRPLTAWTLAIDLDALTNSIGSDDAQKVRSLIQEIVIQGLRASDFTASTADGIVACLPETSQEGAHIIIDAVRRSIADTISVPLAVEFKVFDIGNLQNLVGSLS